MFHAKKVVVCQRCKKQTFFETLDGIVRQGQKCSHCWTPIF